LASYEEGKITEGNNQGGRKNQRVTTSTMGQHRPQQKEKNKALRNFEKGREGSYRGERLMVPQEKT